MDMRVPRALMLAALGGSAAVHAALVPGHAASEPVLAAAFTTAAALLVAVALLVFAEPGRRLPALLAAASLGAMMLAYGADRTVGLPIVGHDHGAPGAHAHGGAGSAVPTRLEVATKGLEAAGVAAALVLLVAPGRSVRRSPPAPLGGRPPALVPARVPARRTNLR